MTSTLAAVVRSAYSGKVKTTPSGLMAGSQRCAVRSPSVLRMRRTSGTDMLTSGASVGANSSSAMLWPVLTVIG